MLGQVTTPWRQASRLKHLFALVFLLAASGVAVTTFVFVMSGHPVTQLPLVSQATRAVAPRYLFSMFGVSYPLGVAVSADSRRVYVTEGDGDQLVRVFDRTGVELPSLVAPGSTAETRSPVYVAVSSDGRVFVSDQISEGVLIFDSAGQYLQTLFSPYPDRPWTPTGVAVGPDGRLYVAGVLGDECKVLIFDRELRLHAERTGPRVIPGRVQSSFDAIAVDAIGRIFIADGVGSRVEMFDADGTFRLTRDEGGLVIPVPKGIWVDQQNKLHAVDSINSAIRVYDLKSFPPTPLYAFGKVGIGDGAFRFPGGITGDSTGRVYVTDRTNNRVQVWSY